LDTEGCWQNIDFNTQLLPIDSPKQYENDENYLNNMRLLEDLLDPSMFEESILGSWDMAPLEKGKSAALNEFFIAKDPKTGEDLKEQS
jgi:hypothetical protein